MKSIKTIFQNTIFLLILIITSYTINASANPIKRIDSPNIKDGDYLEYNVHIATFITNNGSIVFVGTDIMSDEGSPINTQLRIEFHMDDNNTQDYRAIISFSMKGSGYLFYTQNAQGKINFDYNYVIVLIGNINSNLYSFENGTVWGYLPFIIPDINIGDRINASGSILYQNEVVTSIKSGNNYVDNSIGRQETYVFIPVEEINTTAFGLVNNLILRPQYGIDKDTNILLASTINDPFWTIFDREFVLMEGSMVLTSTNFDLGPETFVPLVIDFIYLIIPISIVLIMLLTGVTFFYIVKRQQKLRKVIRKKRKFRK